MKRKTNWTTHLHELIKVRKTLSFAWGSNDCALFVADAIHAMTDTDLGAGLRGQYTSLAGAAVTMQTITSNPEATVEHIAEHFASQAGLTEWKGHLYAQRGDVVLFDSVVSEKEVAEGKAAVTVPALGILYLDGRHGVFVSQEGLNKVPLKDCRRAWRVG